MEDSFHRTLDAALAPLTATCAACHSDNTEQMAPANGQGYSQHRCLICGCRFWKT